METVEHALIKLREIERSLRIIERKSRMYLLVSQVIYPTAILVHVVCGVNAGLNDRMFKAVLLFVFAGIWAYLLKDSVTGWRETVRQAKSARLDTEKLIAEKTKNATASEKT